MKKFKSLLSALPLVVMLVGMCPFYTQAASKFPAETNPFVADYYLEPINQKKPFFDSILPEIRKNIKENNKHSISPTYDAFPKANNPENFQGLGSTTYASINGQKVTAEGFYRLKNEGLNDPNYGMGLLIYQCIQYKRKHPEEDVKITFSSYRTSTTASVCVLPESKYYGYMRSLYGTNYDEHGFVRISYMLTEAARMGIEVTMVNQLNSYAVSQYNPTTKSRKSRAPLQYTEYFAQALESDCYTKYAPGKKVSDFMSFTKVGWNVEDKTSDMQHVKSASVSHYLATDGSEHKNAVFFGSANLDENNYRGANGNNNSQSGVIVSDHAELYRITYNYTRLMYDYRGQEELFEFRKLVNERNEAQAALIQAGRGNEIPRDEQIIYLGTKDDPVFEMYFTPFGGDADAWDTTFNPVAKYGSKLPNSEDYVELIWNEYGYGNCHLGETLSRVVEQAFCNNPNPKNKIAIRVDDFKTDAIQKLKLGSEIGYRSINNGSGIHSKDILMSYKENGVRHNVSLLTSCNFYMIAFNYRTNSMLVINETPECGGDFYHIFADRYSYGATGTDFALDPKEAVLEVGQTYQIDARNATGTLTWSSSTKAVATVNNKGKVTALTPGTTTITCKMGKKTAKAVIKVVECLDCYNKDGGLTCTTNEQYVLSKKFSTYPKTVEAVFKVQQSQLVGTTAILSSDGDFDPCVVFSLNKSGNPRVAIRSKAGYWQSNGSHQDTYTFGNVKVATGKEVHLAFTIDTSKKKIYCYVNGELKQTKTFRVPASFKEKHNMVLGGDHLNGMSTRFPGELMSVSAWSDLRSKTEIASDYKNGTDLSDSKLLASYDLTQCETCLKKDQSSSNHLNYVPLWQDSDAVETPTDYAYSFAVVGDTQTMNEKDPAAMESIYDWILENKEAHKIEYVLGMGDITDDSTDIEWENADNFISKLNGKIPYSLTRGNHDDWDDFNRHLHNGFYETTVDGMMNEGAVELTDPNQPGLIPDGQGGYMTREEDVPEGGTVQGDLTNSYRYFDVAGTNYLIMTIDFAPNSKVLEWANEVIENHPNHKVIVTTHAYMYRDGTTIDKNDCYPPTYYEGYPDAQNGDDMWNKCFSKHENVVLVLSGHDPWQQIAYRQDAGDKGNIVTQMLIDMQYVDLREGSTGMVAMFYFSADGKELTVRYYSVTKDAYGTPASQFTIRLDHKHSYDNACDATCNSCGDTRNAGHTYGPYEYNFDATTAKNGTKTALCTTCGKKSTVTVSGSKLTNVSAFKDVKSNAWFKGAVNFAVTYGIFNGTSNTTFAPNGNMTRAQFVQVFANLSGVDTSNNKVASGFKDVAKGKWYTAAVKWAAENGIVSGIGNNKFAPEDKVTREQMCVMLVNYIEKYQGNKIKRVKTAKDFADDKKISSWAKTAVYKCAYAGIVSGKGSNKFDPAGYATRAEGATLFTNFFKTYMK